MGALLAIAFKDIRLILRDKAGAFFTFVFPLIMAIFFGAIFGGGGGGIQGVHVLVLDLDRTNGSESFIKDLEKGGDVKVDRQPLLAPDPAKKGEWIAADSAAGLKADEAATKEHALNEVRRGNYAASLILPPGFGAAREAPFSGNRMEIQVAIDPSRQATSGMLQGILMKYGFVQLQEGFANPQKMRTMAKDSLDRIRGNAALTPERRAEFDKFFGNLDTMLDSIPTNTTPAPAPENSESNYAGQVKTPAVTPLTPSTTAASAWQPIHITNLPIEREQRGPKNSYEVSFPQGVMWGVIGCTLSFAISFVLERTKGTMIRLRAAPLAAWQILGGKALASFLVTIAVGVGLMAIGVAVFHIHTRSWAMVGASIVATAACFSGIMMLLASITHTERAASGLGWGVLMMFSMVGGGMVPLEFLPEWMAPLSNLSPIRWAIFSLQGGIWRPLEWHDQLLPLGILIGLGAIGFGIGMKLFGNAERA
jgi:ABC-2 type transport system permease protein